MNTKQIRNIYALQVIHEESPDNQKLPFTTMLEGCLTSFSRWLDVCTQ